MSDTSVVASLVLTRKLVDDGTVSNRDAAELTVLLSREVKSYERALGSALDRRLWTMRLRVRCSSLSERTSFKVSEFNEQSYHGLSLTR